MKTRMNILKLAAAAVLSCIAVQAMAVVVDSKCYDTCLKNGNKNCEDKCRVKGPLGL